MHQIIEVAFQDSMRKFDKSRTYHYNYYGDVEVAEGDYAIANNGLVTVCAVYSPNDAAKVALAEKEVVYVVSRKTERDAKRKARRIEEIRGALYSLKAKQQDRQELEEMAALGGEEGKRLLAELETLEN
jgi:hypothetical protein